MILTSLIATFMGFCSLYFAGSHAERPAPGSSDSPRAFGVFLLAILCWVGWLLAVIGLDRLGLNAHPAPAVLVCLAACIGGGLGLWIGNRYSKGGSDAS